MSDRGAERLCRDGEVGFAKKEIEEGDEERLETVSVGAGSKTISVTVEARLLAKTDRFAKKLQVPRAVLIARELQAVVGQEVAIP